MAGVLIFALVNLRLSERRHWLHAGAFALASFSVIVAYTRTVYLALAVVVVLLWLTSPRLRRYVLGALPLALPFLVLGGLVVPLVASELVTTLIERITSPAGTDVSVQWRGRAYDAVLSWATTEPVLGLGFGWRTTFFIGSTPHLIDGGDPHNSYIYIFTGGGLLALGALVSLMVAYIVDSVRRYRRAGAEARALIVWSVSFWCVWMFHALSEPVLTQPSEFLCIALLTLMPAAVTSTGLTPRESRGGDPDSPPPRAGGWMIATRT